MSITFARPDAARGVRLFRGPLVSIMSVAGFLLVWFVAAEIAQSRLLPGPGAVLNYIYDETLHGDLLTELGITLWRGECALLAGGRFLRGGDGHRQRDRPRHGANACARPRARSLADRAAEPACACDHHPCLCVVWT